MIPILYEASETAFTTNGLGRLRDAISCRVVEERNSVYELDLEYPVDGAHYDLITPGRIIYATHDESETPEPFDIVSISRPISGVIEVHAVHISYRLTGITCYGSNINTLQDAFTMFAGAEPENPFSFSTDITTSAYMASADGTPRSVREFMGGVEGSVLDTWGGEYTFTGFEVKLEKSRGVLRDFAIRYGVNMTEYQEDTDYSNTYTSCIPYWTGTDSNGASVIVKGNRVDLGETAYNGRNVCVPLDLTDKFEAEPTTAQLENEALSYMQANNANTPAQTIDVNFARLQDLGYTQYNNLLTCNLCDTVDVIYPYGNATGRYKVVSTTWDVLQDRYEEMTLGTLHTSLSEALGIEKALEQMTSGSGTFTPTAVTFSGSKTSFTSGTSLKTLSVDETLASGLWVVMASARYPSNATGYRALQIVADGSGVNVSLVQQPAGGTGNVDIFTACIVEKTASWVLDLNGRQNSGNSVTVDWYIRAVKIAE